MAMAAEQFPWFHQHSSERSRTQRRRRGSGDDRASQKCVHGDRRRRRRIRCGGLGRVRGLSRSGTRVTRPTARTGATVLIRPGTLLLLLLLLLLSLLLPPKTSSA